MWKLQSVARVDDYAIVPIVAHPNNGTVKPEVDDLFIYRSTPKERVGHVAVVVEALENSVRVAE